MIVCLHGFLGSNKDFNFLSLERNGFIPNLDDYVSHPFEFISKNVYSSLDDKEENILIGYSFGARIAMQLYLENPKSFSKLILLAGHGGLSRAQEIKERQIIEEAFIREIEENSFDDFLTYWNGLDLFSFDKTIAPESRSKKILKAYFDSYGLSKQPYMTTDLIKHKEKITWMFGVKDQKYRYYAKNYLNDFNVEFVSDCGHRLLKNEYVQKRLIEEIKSC